MLGWRVFTSTLLAYLAFYIYFTGVVQVFPLPFGVAGFTISTGYMEGQLYTGPVLQLIYGANIVSVKILPIPLAVALATLFGVNASLLWHLYRKRLLRACLLGGAGGGVGALLASVASFSYACCGWPLSIGLMGVSLISVISPYLTAAALILLAYNAFMLRHRIRVLSQAGLNSPSGSRVGHG